MKAWLIAGALVGLGLMAGPARDGHAQFVSYDDFEGGIIDREKWSGYISGDGVAASPAAELVRTVTEGQLHLGLVSYGGTASDVGGVFAHQGLSVRQLGAPWGTGFITGLKARVTVLAAEAQGCAANPNPESTAPRVQLTAVFFNDGTSAGPGDRTGDIQVYLIILKDAGGANRINVGIQRCQNAACSGRDSLGGGQFTTTWAPDVPVVVKILWQQDLGKFKFLANSEVRNLPYPAGLVAVGPPVRDAKQVSLLNFVEHCTGGRKKGLIEALIDGIAVRRQP